MDSTPSRDAVAGLWSTLSLATRSRPSVATIFSSSGATSRHGPHQGAQKSTRVAPGRLEHLAFEVVVGNGGDRGRGLRGHGHPPCRGAAVEQGTRHPIASSRDRRIRHSDQGRDRGARVCPPITGTGPHPGGGYEEQGVLDEHAPPQGLRQVDPEAAAVVQRQAADERLGARRWRGREPLPRRGRRRSCRPPPRSR